MRKGKKLKLRELIAERNWQHYEVEDVIALARKGVIGLYWRPDDGAWEAEKLTSFSIDTMVNELAIKTERLRMVPDMEHVVSYNEQLIQDFNNFRHEKPELLQHHAGICRLATDLEVEIFGSCESGSIMMLEEKKFIKGWYENYFGFVIVNGVCVAPKYSFRGKEIRASNLYVFEDQVIEYEKKHGLTRQEQVKKPSKQKREHALHELMKDMYAGSDDKSPAEIWKKLKQMGSQEGVINHMDQWTEVDAKIQWTSHTGKLRTMDRRSFENEISKLNTKKVSQ
jgi:hypothetical protein